jgi:putative FmdB family regulatory protein
MVYAFRCKKCEAYLDIAHPVNEPHPDKCLFCGGELVRVFHLPSVIYRGSGFYTTDKVLSDPPDQMDM